MKGEIGMTKTGKYFKKITGLVVLTSFLVSSTLTTYASTNISNEGVDFELLADGISAKQKLDSEFKKIGINLDDVLKLPQREDFMQEGKRYIESTKNKNIAFYNVEDETRTLEAERLAYAAKMAKWSQSVNPSVDINKETLYMFLSHYIDVPYPLDASNGIDTNSTSNNIYGKFITQYDRDTYNLYISRGAAKRGFESYMNTINFALNVKDLSNTVNTVKDAGKVLTQNIFQLTGEMGMTASNGEKLYSSYKTAHIEGKSLEETVELLASQIEPKPGISGRTIAESFVGLLLTVGTMGPVAIPMMLMNLYIDLGLNLYDKANFYGMRMYFNFRLYDRMSYKSQLGM